MKNKEREIWVGKSRLSLGEDNILYLTVVGIVDEKTVSAIIVAILKIRGKMEGKIDLLVDITEAGKPLPGARKIGKEWLEDEKIGKVAIFGTHPVARVIASFFMGISQKKDMRFFKTKEEALAWLKE